MEIVPINNCNKKKVHSVQCSKRHVHTCTDACNFVTVHVFYLCLRARCACDNFQSSQNITLTLGAGRTCTVHARFLGYMHICMYFPLISSTDSAFMVWLCMCQANKDVLWQNHYFFQMRKHFQWLFTNDLRRKKCQRLRKKIVVLNYSWLDEYKLGLFMSWSSQYCQLDFANDFDTWLRHGICIIYISIHVLEYGDEVYPSQCESYFFFSIRCFQLWVSPPVNVYECAEIHTISVRADILVKNET